MDVVFLDANVLFSAAYRSTSRFRQLWQVTTVELVTSSYAIEEARRNLKTTEQQKALEALTKSVRIVTFSGLLDHPVFSSVTLPDKDRPILLAALEAKATHLLTGDIQHFGPYFGQRIAGIMIVPPADYFRQIAAADES